jgi:segregation and condensation protein A
LLEYKRIKEGAHALQQLTEIRRSLFERGYGEALAEHGNSEQREIVLPPTLYQLMVAYRSVLERMPRQLTRNVMDAPVTVEEQSAVLLSRLQQEPQLSFTALLEGINDRLIVVVTFLAILELCKNQRIVVLVNDTHDEFWIALR